MDAEIIAVLTPERLKELLESAQTLESTANKFCHCCFTREGTLHSYALKTFALMNAFEVQFLTLCYICKQVAQQAEKFIDKVQNNQRLFAVYDNAELSEPAYDPLKRLVKSDLEHSDIHTVGLGQNRIDGNTDVIQVKSEIDEGNNSNDNDQTTEQTQINTNKDNVDDELMLLEEKIICDDDKEVDDEVKSSRENLALMNKLLVGKIIKMTISKEQCLKERAEKAKMPSFVAAKYKCTLCVSTMHSWKQLSKHVDVFHNYECGPYECEICKRRKLTQSGLNMHTSLHLVRYKCAECGMAKSRYSCAKFHYLKEHTDKRTLFPCNVCRKWFKSQYELNVHKKKRGHGANQIGLCKYCHTYPKRSSHLKWCSKKAEEKRKKLMRQANPFYCAVCNKSFANHLCFTRHSNGLRHIRKLDKIGQSNVKCDYCGKEYKEKGFLLNHILTIHMKKYKMPCKLCKRKFFCESSMKRHVTRYHTVSCEICTETFYSKESLDEHRLKLHQKEKTFACKACDIDFVGYKLLFEHDNTVHRKRGEMPEVASDVQEI